MNTNTIKITVASNSINPFTFMFEGTTVGELRTFLSNNNITTIGKTLREGNLKIELLADETELPRVKADGTPVEELFIMISEPNNKIKSGIIGIIHVLSEENETPSQEDTKPITGISESTKESITDKMNSICDILDELYEEIENIPVLADIATRVRQVQSSFTQEQIENMVRDLDNL